MPDFREINSMIEDYYTGGLFFDPQTGDVLEIIDLDSAAGEPGLLIEIGYLGLTPERLERVALGPDREDVIETVEAWEDERWHADFDDLPPDAKEHLRIAYEEVMPYFGMDVRKRLLLLPWLEAAEATEYINPDHEDVIAAGEAEAEAWGAELILTEPGEDPKAVLYEVLSDEGVMMDWPPQYKTLEDAVVDDKVEFIY